MLIYYFADGFESSQGRGKIPTFSIPSLPLLTEGAPLSESFQNLQIFAKKLSETLEEVSKTTEMGKEGMLSLLFTSIYFGVSVWNLYITLSCDYILFSSNIAKVKS